MSVVPYKTLDEGGDGVASAESTEFSPHDNQSNDITLGHQMSLSNETTGAPLRENTAEPVSGSVCQQRTAQEYKSSTISGHHGDVIGQSSYLSLAAGSRDKRQTDPSFKLNRNSTKNAMEEREVQQSNESLKATVPNQNGGSEDSESSTDPTKDNASLELTTLSENGTPPSIMPSQNGAAGYGSLHSNGTPPSQENGVGAEKRKITNGGMGETLTLVPKDTNDKSPLQDVSLEEDARLLESHPPRDVSNLRTYMNLYKALTGPSTVGMPRVIANGGLLSGFVGFLAIGFINAYCNIVMVNNSRILGKRTGKTWYTYEDVFQESFSTPRAAKYGRRLALGMLILCQFGLMSFYFQIIATTVKKEIEESFPELPITLVQVEACVLVCILPYSMLRNLRLLAWFSSAANILDIASILVFIIYSVTHMQPVSSVDLVPSNPWTIPLFVGGAVFTVEGIAMILPIENRAEKPADYTGPFGIVALAAATNIILNLAVGFYGYLAFGNDVSGNILVSLPNVWIYRLVSIMFALMVFLTFNFQLYQPAEAIDSWLKGKIKNGFMLKYGNMVVRAVLVVLAFSFAALIPKVELMMSLIGAFCAGFLVFILPIIAEILILRREPGGISWPVLIKDIVILIFGVLAFSTGTYASLMDIINALAG